MSRTYRRTKLKCSPKFESKEHFESIKERMEAGNKYDPYFYYEYHEAKRFPRNSGGYATYEKYYEWCSARFHSDKGPNPKGCKEHSPYQISSEALSIWRRYIRNHHRQTIRRALQWDLWDEMLLLRSKKPSWWYYL